MLETEAAAIAAGLLCGGAVVVAGLGLPRRRMVDTMISTPRISAARGRLSDAGQRFAVALERAGWRQAPEHVAAVAIAVAVCLSLVAAAVAVPLAPLGFAAGGGTFVLLLDSSIARRRRRLAAELVPLLELFTLELSSGGGALTALGSVAMQVDGELATELRAMLIAAQVSGSQSFEARLLRYAERTQLPALSTLATILGANRDFGTGATQGVRALATDLRRAQRRELIEHSRKALNHVLLPAAVGVLLPFLCVLMFPAVSVLQRSLR